MASFCQINIFAASTSRWDVLIVKTNNFDDVIQDFAAKKARNIIMKYVSHKTHI